MEPVASRANATSIRGRVGSAQAGAQTKSAAALTSERRDGM
jgi:hypothetical protein